MTAVNAPTTIPVIPEIQIWKMTVKIYRFNPETDKKAHWQSFQIEAESGDRVLDVLNNIKWYQDPTLTFRRSCAHGVCGSDAMLINGRNRLACKILIKDLIKNGGTLTVEPIRGLTVERDLIVDMEPFFDSYRAVLPFFINEDAPPAAERLQSPEDRERFDHGTKCILCAACTTSCPIFWVNGRYLGPAAIVQAHRFIFDSRDKGADQRLAQLNQNTGVWRCRTAYNCTEACPRDIPITQLIEEVKRAIVYQQA
jgi:succinate dehydrogenase / fumarate reductase, iron-sulfur subunit